MCTEHTIRYDGKNISYASRPYEVVPTGYEYWEDYCKEKEKRSHIVPSHCEYIDWDNSQHVPIRIRGADYYIMDILGEPELVRMDE